MGVWDFPAQKSVNYSKLLHKHLCFLLKLELTDFKRNLWKLGNASQRGEVLPGCSALPRCGSTALGFGWLQSQAWMEEEVSCSFCCFVAPSFAPLLVTSLRVLFSAPVLQFVAGLPGMGLRGFCVISCGTGDDSFIEIVLALGSFFPGVGLR